MKHKKSLSCLLALAFLLSSILPLSAAGGAAFVIICDYIAHFAAPYYGVLPIGVVTSLIGAPFFIYLLCARKREVGW